MGSVKGPLASVINCAGIWIGIGVKDGDGDGDRDLLHSLIIKSAFAAQRNALKMCATRSRNSCALAFIYGQRGLLRAIKGGSLLTNANPL